MDARMAQRVFALPLIFVDCLGRECVTDKLGVQIARMIRRFQRESEIIHREHIFKELRLLEIANASGLAGIVQRMREGVGSRVEVVIVL